VIEGPYSSSLAQQDGEEALKHQIWWDFTGKCSVQSFFKGSLVVFFIATLHRVRIDSCSGRLREGLFNDVRELTVSLVCEGEMSEC
jgi:hypothetical protein